MRRGENLSGGDAAGKNSKSGAGAGAAPGLKGLLSGGGGGGDELWRKLVERNLMKPEKKEKPVYKFDKANIISEKEPKPDLEREKADFEALKSSLSKNKKKDKRNHSSVSSSEESSFDSNLGTLHESSATMASSADDGTKIAEEMGLEGSKAEEEAAKMIQNKFRGLKIGGMKKKPAAAPAPKDKDKEAAEKKGENGEGGLNGSITLNGSKMTTKLTIGGAADSTKTSGNI